MFIVYHVHHCCQPDHHLHKQTKKIRTKYTGRLNSLIWIFLDIFQTALVPPAPTPLENFQKTLKSKNLIVPNVFTNKPIQRILFTGERRLYNFKYDFKKKLFIILNFIKLILFTGERRQTSRWFPNWTALQPHPQIQIQKVELEIQIQKCTKKWKQKYRKIQIQKDRNTNGYKCELKIQQNVQVSCNRMLGNIPAPECLWTTTTTSPPRQVEKYLWSIIEIIENQLSYYHTLPFHSWKKWFCERDPDFGKYFS